MPWLGCMKEHRRQADFELYKARSIGSDILRAMRLIWLLKAEISLPRLGWACLHLGRAGMYEVFASVKLLEL